VPLRRPLSGVALALAAAVLAAGCGTGGKAVAHADQANGATLFTGKCGSCHTLKPAGASATIGPDLDKLKQYAAQAHRGPLDAFIKESIVNPGVYLQPGYKNLMPPTFGQQIPADKLNRLVQYLLKNAK